MAKIRLVKAEPIFNEFENSIMCERKFPEAVKRFYILSPLFTADEREKLAREMFDCDPNGCDYCNDLYTRLRCARIIKELKEKYKDKMVNDRHFPKRYWIDCSKHHRLVNKWIKEENFHPFAYVDEYWR